MEGTVSSWKKFLLVTLGLGYAGFHPFVQFSPSQQTAIPSIQDVFCLVHVMWGSAEVRMWKWPLIWKNLDSVEQKRGSKMVEKDACDFRTNKQQAIGYPGRVYYYMWIIKKEFMKDGDFSWSSMNEQNFISREVWRISKENIYENKDSCG